MKKLIPYNITGLLLAITLVGNSLKAQDTKPVSKTDTTVVELNQAIIEPERLLIDVAEQVIAEAYVGSAQIFP